MSTSPRNCTLLKSYRKLMKRTERCTNKTLLSRRLGLICRYERRLMMAGLISCAGLPTSYLSGQDLCASTARMLVNTEIFNVQELASVAINPEGNHVIVWQSTNQDGDQIGIFARRFDSEGTPIDDEEFQVNTLTTRNQSKPAIAMDRDGNFAVAWMSNAIPDSALNYDIYTRRFDAAGMPLDSVEFLVNTITYQNEHNPSIGMDADGNFVIVWTHDVASSAFEDYDIYARRFNAEGMPLDPTESKINIGSGAYLGYARVVMDQDGDYVVAWHGDSDPGSQINHNIYARRFDSFGLPLDVGEIRVNTLTNGDQRYPSLAVDQRGGFAITWSAEHPDNSFNAYTRRFTVSGEAKDSIEFQVNTTTIDAQVTAQVAIDSDGDLTVVWRTTNGITMRRFSASGMAYDIDEVLRRYRKPFPMH